MTKDRRLGRGLAALLGTPMEEDGIVEAAEAASTSASTEKIATSPAAAARANTNTLATKQSASPPKQKSSVQDSVGTRPSKKTARPANKAVTGSVPLKTTATSGQSLELSVYEIDNNPFQPRRQFNTEEIASLAESIREHKQLQPVLVRQVGERYQLISGERRLRATIHAGLKTIRAEVREADDRLVAELAIVENLQRKDLDPIEKALSFRRYIDQHKCTQDDLAKRLKIDRSTIANLMRLLELPEEIQQWVQSGSITAGHARALLPLSEESQQLRFAQQIKEEHWSVRETERRVAEQLAIEDGETPQPKKPGRKGASPQVAALEQQLRLSLGTKTEVKQSAKGRGKIVINFSNADEFDRLLSLICPEAAAQRAA